MMKKEGALQYSVDFYVEEEVRAAVAEASGSLDKIIEEEPAKGIEAAVASAPVIYSGNEASYRADAAELPENYKDSGYKAADDDDEAEVSYSQNDSYVLEAAEEFDSEINAELKANTLKISNTHLPKSAEAAERLENYKISIGFAMRFLLYSIKATTF
jgi:hypothetical protein